MTALCGKMQVILARRNSRKKFIVTAARIVAVVRGVLLGVEVADRRSCGFPRQEAMLVCPVGVRGLRKAELAFERTDHKTSLAYLRHAKIRGVEHAPSGVVTEPFGALHNCFERVAMHLVGKPLYVL